MPEKEDIKEKQLPKSDNEPADNEDGLIEDGSEGITHETKSGIHRALVDSEKRYRLLAEHATDCIWTINPWSLEFTYISPSIKRIRGYKSEEAIKQPLFQILTDDSLKLALETLKEEIEIEESGTGDPSRTRTLELEMYHEKGHTVWTETKFSFLHDENKKLKEIQGVTRDITERKNLQEQLAHSQRMEAIGILAGGVAHDFNNILTAILGYADMIRLDLEGNKVDIDQMIKDINEVLEAAHKAQSLTQQLLAFSRKQELAIEITDINPIIKNFDKMLKGLIGEDIKIEIKLDGSIDNVKVDKAQIEQVLMNLSLNAKDAMPEGGSLTISTEEILLDETYCHLDTDARQGKFICITVKDTGTGMGRVTMSRIFEPFFTSKEKGKGSGLGLSVVYGIIKQHEGWIKVDSREGKGSIFKIFLPAYEEKSESDTKKTMKIEGLYGQNERILLIEDDEKVRKLLQMTLNKYGYKVFTAANADAAIELFQKEDSNFDLVFSDVVLPGRDGLKVVDEIMSINPDINVLMSSGYTDGKSRWERIMDKGYSYLQKPYNIKKLLKALREIFETEKEYGKE